MKNYLKSLGVVVLTVITLASCSGNAFKKISNQEDVNSIMESAANAIPEANVKEVEIRSSDALTESFGSVTVVYDHDGKYYRMSYSTQGVTDPTEAILIPVYKKYYKKAEPLKVSDFKFENINDLLTKSIKAIEKQTQDFEGYKLHSIEKRIGKDGIVTEISIDATKKGEQSVRQGRTQTTNYYRVNLEVNKDGSVKIIS